MMADTSDKTTSDRFSKLAAHVKARHQRTLGADLVADGGKDLTDAEAENGDVPSARGYFVKKARVMGQGPLKGIIPNRCERGARQRGGVQDAEVILLEARVYEPSAPKEAEVERLERDDPFEPIVSDRGSNIEAEYYSNSNELLRLFEKISQINGMNRDFSTGSSIISFNNLPDNKLPTQDDDSVGVLKPLGP